LKTAFRNKLAGVGFLFEINWEPPKMTFNGLGEISFQ